jgi:hypothetical protein
MRAASHIVRSACEEPHTPRRTHGRTLAKVGRYGNERAGGA